MKKGVCFEKLLNIYVQKKVKGKRKDEGAENEKINGKSE